VGFSQFAPYKYFDSFQPIQIKNRSGLQSNATGSHNGIAPNIAIHAMRLITILSQNDFSASRYDLASAVIGSQAIEKCIPPRRGGNCFLWNRFSKITSNKTLTLAPLLRTGGHSVGCFLFS
jgi:hypothetical protein